MQQWEQYIEKLHIHAHTEGGDRFLRYILTTHQSVLPAREVAGHARPAQGVAIKKQDIVKHIIKRTKGNNQVLHYLVTGNGRKQLLNTSVSYLSMSILPKESLQGSSYY